MPWVQLTRNKSYGAGKLTFVRGQKREVDEGLYNYLIQTGKFHDPGHTLDNIHPNRLAKLLRDSPGAPVTILRNMGLGDVLMMTPSLRALKAKYPSARITYATSAPYVPLFKGLPYLEDCVIIHELSGRIPNVIDMRGWSEKAPDRHEVHRIDVYADYMGLKLTDHRLDCVLRDSPTDPVADRLLAAGRDPTKPLITAALRGSTPIRSIPRPTLEAFTAIATAMGWQVLLVDSHPGSGWTGTDILDGCGIFKAHELAVIATQSDVCLSSDTGLAHVAAAVGTPCVAVYSSWPPDLRLRYYENMYVIWHKDQCSACPCWDNAPMPICGALGCLNTVTPEEIVAQVERALLRAGTPRNGRQVA